MGSWEGKCFVCDKKTFIRYKCDFCSNYICEQCMVDHYYECITENAYDMSFNSDLESK